MDRRAQIRFTPEEQATFLREHRKAALATMDKDGFPHLVAMNFYAKDGAFYMTSYGKAQKVVNIRRNPRVALMIEAEHTCIAMRGVRKEGVSTVTTQFTGVFRDDPNEQTRFFNLLRGAR